MALDLSATATSLINSLGDKTYVTITRKTGGMFDPVAGTITGEITTQLTASGVVTKLDNRLIDGSRIEATDKMIILDNGITPLMTDLITFGGVNHTVIEIEEVNHGGITQMWSVIVRG